MKLCYILVLITQIISKLVDDVMETINKKREANGLKPLVRNKHLDWAAKLQAKYMKKVKKATAEQEKEKYADPPKRIDATKYGSWYRLTEIVGLASANNVDSVMDIFVGDMNKNGGKQTIISPVFEDAGIGYAEDKKGGSYWSLLLLRKTPLEDKKDENSNAENKKEKKEKDSSDSSKD
ncbi:hypothetical protein EDEG_01234 [Edhazardia aedis USNM 41457]|uniref:SCP domain-containing protein n=1 Tax=Edhazardia aedis (strain USNM 41457) TaxID=1003232 RepID=J9DA04_EDHAE|nr:hypothetical protein EDEG_01234 [Edhazardia aedis USNM 41457]|eukprot:EJW04551.1 hypothetical protein EDEG_01234 [Edhazardia aedis USNM 41457]